MKTNLEQFEKEMEEVENYTATCLKTLPENIPVRQLVFVGSQLMALALSEAKNKIRLRAAIHLARKVLEADALKFYEAKVKYEKTKNNSI